jgi:hypothetical protein
MAIGAARRQGEVPQRRRVSASLEHVGGEQARNIEVLFEAGMANAIPTAVEETVYFFRRLGLALRDVPARRPRAVDPRRSPARAST